MNKINSKYKVKKNPRIFCTIFYGNSFFNWEFLFNLGIPFLKCSVDYYINCLLYHLSIVYYNFKLVYFSIQFKKLNVSTVCHISIAWNKK